MKKLIALRISSICSSGISRHLVPSATAEAPVIEGETLPEVDPERIGLWGTSFDGGHAPYAAAVDSRIKAAVGQVGCGDGERFLLDTRIFGERAELLRKVADDRRRRAVEGTGERIDPLDALNSNQTRDFLAPALKGAPAMRCDLSWETMEKTLEYKPIEVVGAVLSEG